MLDLQNTRPSRSSSAPVSCRTTPRTANLNQPDETPKATALCLDQFMKLAAIAATGGHAKILIQGGEVKVNGQIETRRRRKLAAEDVVEMGGQRWRVKDYVAIQ